MNIQEEIKAELEEEINFLNSAIEKSKRINRDYSIYEKNLAQSKDELKSLQKK